VRINRDMVNDSEQFRVTPGIPVKLADIDPDFKGRHPDHVSAATELQHYTERLRILQELLYANGGRALSICLEAMDTGGKDGVINHVLGAMNPQGCRVAHFRRPSSQEAAHDFLWRAHRDAPARGEVVIFNRSHYEDVLVVRVHERVDKCVWAERYARINEFERNLTDAGVAILKFYLHISSQEQLQRFKARLDDPSKHWKISEADYAERKFWPKYQCAYEEMLLRCSTQHAPWYVIPANHKWFRNLAIARTVVECLEAMNLKFPEPEVDLARIRREYHSAAQR
jgi:PPK2 family polyphosphate:nucleotide phosphotransferase